MDAKRKYAYEWNTLPIYIYQNSNGEWANFEYDIATIQTIINPLKFYTDINASALIPLSLKLYDICLFYVLGNHQFQQYIQNLQLDTFYYRTEHNVNEETERVLQELIRQVFDPQQYGKLIKSIEDNKLLFRSAYEQEIREDEFIRSFGTIPHDPFSTESLVKEYKIEGILNRDIYSLLNQTRLSEKFPLAVTPEFYKVLKGYEYTLDIPDEECMYLFTYKGKVTIYLDKIQYSVQKDEQDHEYLMEICQCIDISLDALTPMREKLNGICIYPRQTLDMAIWRDLVMNNRYVAKNLVIDEHNLNIRVQKRKVFFMYFFDKDNNKITLTLREVDRGVRLRILNGISPENIDEIINYIGSSLAIYNGLGHRIAQDYNKLLGKDMIHYESPEPTKDIDYNKPLKVIAPEMFLPGYTRSCQFLPRIIPFDEAQEIEQKEGFAIMKFPKDVDSERPLLFTCEQHRKKGYVYPGLRLNSLKNKETFPILPCCYQEDQHQRNTLFKEYYMSDKRLKEFTSKGKAKIQYRFLISEKFVGLDQKGKCPEDIDQLFSLYTMDKPYRKGVHRSKLSALECVLVRLNINGYVTKNSQMRLKQLEEEFKNLSTFNLEICAQECWNILNISEFLSTDSYLDLRFFIRLLERAYQCRIVLLGRTDFIHPNFIEGYIRWETNPTQPIVILFEHMGSESDKATYPQCELVELKTDDNVVYQSIFKDYVKSLYTVTPEPSIISTSLFEILDKEYEITEQHIDFYGKVYALNVKRKSNDVLMTLFFIGMRAPPMDLPSATVTYYVSSLPSNFSGNRYKIEIGEFKFYVYTSPHVQSKLKMYENTRLKSIIILENAKYLYSKTGNFDFIQVSPDAMDILYSKYLFTETNVIYVPNEEAKKRLIYSVTLFETRFRSQIELYKDLELIPFKYQSVQDFDTQSNVIIAQVSNVINWFSDFYTLKPIDGTLYTTPFICKILKHNYKCIPIAGAPDGAFKILFPQIKRIFTINCTDSENIYLVIKNTKNVYNFYKCTKILI